MTSLQNNLAECVLCIFLSVLCGIYISTFLPVVQHSRKLSPSLKVDNSCDVQCLQWWPLCIVLCDLSVHGSCRWWAVHMSTKCEQFTVSYLVFASVHVVCEYAIWSVHVNTELWFVSMHVCMCAASNGKKSRVCICSICCDSWCTFLHLRHLYRRHWQPTQWIAPHSDRPAALSHLPTHLCTDGMLAFSNFSVSINTEVAGKKA